jgi:hypothetical protein
MKNLSTRTKPDGGALAGIIERFISGAKTEADSKGVNAQMVIREKLAHISEMTNGYDFASVITAYWHGFEGGQEQAKNDAVRWLRGEYTTKTEARTALGVRTIIDDSSFYDQLKLMSRFLRLAGYCGFVVCLDEMVNLYKMANTQARNANYEQILHILNDSLQGNSEGLGFIMGGTPEFLMDVRRGLFSYPALQRRLAENSFAKNGLVDFTHPVLRLANLTPEEYLVLLRKLRDLYAYGDPGKYLIDDKGLIAFMDHCNQRIGESYFRTPGTTITAFVNLLAVLEQNPDTHWSNLIGDIRIERDMGFQNEALTEDTPDNHTGKESEDGFASFKL